MNSETSDPLTARIIGAAIDVHRELGPGFLEAIYEEALAVLLKAASISFTRQVVVPIYFRQQLLGEHRLDLLVDGQVVIELKAVKAIEDVHYAIVRSYLKATGCERGLLLNFSAPALQVKRIGAEFRARK